jgi:UDP-N-acetylmuramate dehydrogenase
MSLSSTSSTVIEKIAAIPGVELREHEPLARHVSMGVGGPARWFAVIDHLEALQAALALLREGGIEWMILGGGSNTLFTDRGHEGLILSLGRGFKTVTAGPAPHQVTAGAGAPLSAVMNFAKRAGLAGLEFSAGIPGTLGGALAGNAGTAAGDVCSLADSVTVLDGEGRLLTRERGAFQFGYRTSDLRRDVIVQATLALCPDSAEAIQARIAATLAKRGEQPIGVRCSGCTFKNPEGDYAGRMIDSVGLKGFCIGGASVSDKHANFILNDGTATAGDICNLIETIRQRIFERYKIHLELEIRIVGLDSAKKIH